MRNLIDKYQEKILDLGVGYFDLSGQIGNDRIILNLYESEHVNGLKAGIVLNLTTSTMSVFGRGGFDINENKCTPSAYITCDGDEYLFDENNKNEELGLKMETTSAGYKLSKDSSNVEQYYEYNYVNKNYLTKIKDKNNDKEITYTYDGECIRVITNNEKSINEDGIEIDLSERISYTYNDSKLCTRLDIYKGDVLLRKIHFEYNTSTNLLSRIYCYRLVDGVQKLSYDYTLAEGLMTLTGKSYIFSDTITGLSKTIKYNINNLLSEITYEDGQYIEINEGAITPSYAITEEEKLKTKVQCYFDANHRLVDIERYNNIHSLRKYDGNKLLLSCDACFKDVNYLGKVVDMRINPECTNGEQLELTHEEGTPDNLIEGLDDSSLFKLNKNVTSKAELYYGLEQHKVYTVIVIVDKNNKGKLKLKTISYDENDEIIEESREYLIENRYFAYSFKIPKNSTKVDIEILGVENKENEYVIFNAFVIDKGICNVYTYNQSNNLIKKLEDGVETFLKPLSMLGIAITDTKATFLSTTKNIKSTIDIYGNEVSYDYDEDNQLIKQTKKLNGNTILEETRTYDANKQLETVSSTIDASTVINTYNSDYSLLSVSKGNDKVTYTYDESVPKVVNIEFSNNNTVLKNHGFAYGNDQILNGINEDGSSKYTYTYDSLKRITSVKLKGVLVEGYTYDSRFPDLIIRKYVEGCYEDYEYDIFKNVTSITRTKGTFSEVFSFVYNDDNLLIKVLYNGNIVEQYIYSYGKLKTSVINDVTYEYIRNEKDEIVDKKIISNSTSSVRHEKSYYNDTIFKLFKEILEQDENIFGTLYLNNIYYYLDEDENECQKKLSSVLLNKKEERILNVNAEDNVFKNGFYYNIPYCRIDKDNGYELKYVVSDKLKKFSFFSFIRFNLGVKELFKIMGVYTSPPRYTLLLDKDNQLCLYCGNENRLLYTYKIEDFNRFYLIGFNFDNGVLEFYIDNELICTDSITLEETDYLNYVEVTNQNSTDYLDLSMTLFGKNKVFLSSEINSIYDRLNKIIDSNIAGVNHITTTNIKTHTFVEEDVTYDEITFSNSNISRNGIRPLQEIRNIYGSEDFSYIYDKDLEGVCLNGMGLSYDLGLRESGTISFKAKMMDNSKDSCLLNIKDNSNFFKLIYNSDTNVFEIILFDFEGSPLDVNPFVWHDYILTWSRNIQSDSIENTIVNVKLYIDGVLKYSASPTLESTGQSNNLYFYINGECSNTIDSQFNIFNNRISSIRFNSSFLTDSGVSALYNSKRYNFVNEYNSMGLLLTKRVENNNTTISQQDYVYDSKLRIKSENFGSTLYEYSYDNKNNLSYYETSNGLLYEYSYDNRNRLISEGEPDLETEYVYDNRNNLTSISFRRETIKTFTYDALDRITSHNGKTITYSSTTSLYPIQIITDSGRIVLTWNGNKLYEYKEYLGTSLNKHLRFEYDQYGLRRRKINLISSKVTRYNYDENSNLVLETSGDVTLKYYYDSNNLLTSFSLNGVMYFYNRDVFGNIKHIFDSNNQIVVSYDCKAYGQDMVVSGTLANTIGLFNPFRYKGYYYDVENQLYWVSSRYYSPELGRFIQPADVSTLNPSSINGLNLYSYANNNPIRIAYRSSGANGDIVSSIASSVGGLNSGYHGTISNSSNIFGALGALSTTFGFFDQWSGYIVGGLDGGLGFFGPNGFGFKGLGKYSDALGKFGKGMAIAGGIISWVNSVYNNFTNPNYTTGDAFGASVMDAAYYGVTGVLKYKAGLAIGSFAITAGMTVGTAAVGLAGAIGLSITGSLIAGLVVGGIVAIGIGFAGAYAIYYIGGLIDDVWEWFKKQIFE